MADLSSVADNFFTIASETFADNLSASIAAGALVVPVNNASEYTNGDCVALTVDPGTVNEATFIGKKNGNQFEECIWTEGNTSVGHSSGATIIDYDSATHHNAQTKGIKQFANDDGTLITAAVRAALGLGSAAVNGWEVLPYTVQVTTGYNKGNKSAELTVSNNDLTDELSAGMRLRLQRGTTAPTQCLDLELGSSQYASKTTPAGLSFTDDFTTEAWINHESYGTKMGIVARRNADTEGWSFDIDSSGRVVLSGLRIAGNNKTITSYQSIPLDIWTHVAASLDMSGGTGVIYINGIAVPSFITTTGTANALVQGTTALVVGATKSAGTESYDGKISDVRVWSEIRTATQVRDNMNQQLTGSETNLVSYFKLNGDLEDSTTNNNDLTGSGGAVATSLDNPMKDTEYAIVTKVAYSAPNTTITVFTGNKNNIPNMTLNAPYYSTQKAPYGFPSARTNWCITTIGRNVHAETVVAQNVWYHATIGSLELTLPVGEWDLGYDTSFGAYRTGTSISCFSTLSTANNAESDTRLSASMVSEGASATISAYPTMGRHRDIIQLAEAIWYLNFKSDLSGVTAIQLNGTSGATVITAECAYA